jgi:hypothetical protein
VYRAFNKMTVRNEYSLPKIDELLDTLQSTRFFTTLDDLSSNKNQGGEYSKDSIHLYKRYYEFLVMTFRLTNTLATF